MKVLDKMLEWKNGGTLKLLSVGYSLRAPELLFRKIDTIIEILLVHTGGPFWKNKDEGAWSIPKGELDDAEDALAAAKREFKEETGYTCNGKFVELTPIKLKSGKTVLAWALEKDIDASKIKSNHFRVNRKLNINS